MIRTWSGCTSTWSRGGARRSSWNLSTAFRLRDILVRQGKTTAEAALVILMGSLLGLAAAHRRGVVHRAYKPENVLVNGDGDSKLTDFGIAARAGDSPYLGRDHGVRAAA